MSTQVIRIEGYSKGGLTYIGNECDRKPGIKHRNSDINPDRTCLNKSYKDCPDGFYAEFHQILSSTQCTYKEKKDGKPFEGMIITSDLAFFEKMGYSNQDNRKPPKEVRDFFDNAYKWALEQIGYNGTDKNILSAKVHYDEKTPHLHIYYLPMTNKWNKKVYAKDMYGKVLRSEKGTPIQAKDERGKTLFERVESPAPKLSKTDFWHNKGGKNSYRMLQDDFYARIGKEYGLERGEIGSTRKHETKYQYTERTLKAELKPLKDMKVKTEKIKENKTKIPLVGKTIVSTREWERTTRQAQAYAVNRDEIKSNREDRAKLNADGARIDEERSRLENMRLETERAYERQKGLNKALETAERILEERNDEVGDLRLQVQSLAQDLQASKKYYKMLEETIADNAQAIGMLKYDKSRGYKVEGLTKQQERLIDGVRNHDSALMKSCGRSDLSDKINKNICVSKGIQKQIDLLTPQERSRGFSR